MKLKKSFPVAIAVSVVLASFAYGSVLTVTPRLSVEESYTDNSSLSENNTESDYVTTISPSVNMDFMQKHMGVDFFYDYQHQIYGDKTENNSSRHSAGLTGWAELSKRTKLTLGERFLRVEDPLREEDRILLPDEDPYLMRDSLVRRSRDPYYTYNSSAGLAHQFGENDYLNLNYLFSVREDKAADGNSSKRHTPGVGVTYWVTPQYGIDASFDYTRARFDNNGKIRTTNLNNSDAFDDEDFDDMDSNLKVSRKITKHFDIYIAYNHVVRDFKNDGQVLSDVLGRNQNSDYQIHSPSTGISYEIDKDTSFSLGVGYFFQNLKDEEDDPSGLFVDSSLTRNWRFQRGSFRLSGSSGMDRNDFGYQSRGFERFYDLAGKLTYELTRHLSGNLGTGLRRNEFINDKRNETDNNDEIENRVIFNAGLNYRPKRWMTASTNYTHSLLYSDDNNNLRDSTPDTNDQGNGTVDDHSRFNIGVTFTPKEWLFINMNYSHSRLNSDLSEEDNEENRASISITLVPERPYRHVY
ncbi:MAG: outer membrane beta-barrel protein [Pseudomonadota bacterium]